MHTHINITNQFGRSFRALLTHYQTSAREPYIDIVDAESDKKITQFFRKTFISKLLLTKVRGFFLWSVYAATLGRFTAPLDETAVSPNQARF